MDINSTAKQKIIFSLTVDWEGEHFKDINDLKGMRNHIGNNIPITHFISASYFTKEISDAKNIIQKQIYPQDEVAVHIHPHRHLTKAAGVSFIDTPDFFEPYTPEIRFLINLLPKSLQPKNSGRGVPISAYKSEDIQKLLLLSKQKLQKIVARRPITGFRAGGWMCSDTVIEALEKTDFKYDSSAVPPEILSQGYSIYKEGNKRDEHNGRNGVFTEYMLALWGHKRQIDSILANKNIQTACPDTHIKKTTQPFKVNSLFEMPNNAGMSDYASAEQSMMYAVEEAVKKLQSGYDKPLFINTGFHQEGDIRYKLPIIEFFDKLSPEYREFIEFKTVEEARQTANDIYG